MLALACLILGILHVVYAGRAYSKINNTFFGCWWGGVMISITAASTGFTATSNCRMSTAMGFSIVATIVGFVASILDAVAFGYLKQLSTCTNQEREVFGNEDWTSYSNLCQLGNPDYDCVCVRDETDTDCYGFHLANDSGNCDIVLETTPRLLHSAFAIGFVVSFLMMFFSCITCGSTCCPAKCCGPAEEAGSTEPMASQEVHSQTTYPPPVVQALVYDSSPAGYLVKSSDTV